MCHVYPPETQCALNTDFETAPVRSTVKISATVYPKSIAICRIMPSVLLFSDTIALENSVLKIPSAMMIKNP